MPADERMARTSPLLLTVAWLVVGITAAWGVSQTVMRSMDLFTPPATSAATVPASPPAR